jgi:hypothetical protein
MKTEISNVGIWILILLALASFIPAIHFIDRQSMFEIVDGLGRGWCSRRPNQMGSGSLECPMASS